MRRGNDGPMQKNCRSNEQFFVKKAVLTQNNGSNDLRLVILFENDVDQSWNIESDVEMRTEAV